MFNWSGKVAIDKLLDAYVEDVVGWKGKTEGQKLFISRALPSMLYKSGTRQLVGQIFTNLRGNCL